MEVIVNIIKYKDIYFRFLLNFYLIGKKLIKYLNFFFIIYRIVYFLRCFEY